MLALMLMLLVQLPDDGAANPQRRRQQQRAGDVFHARQRARRNAPVPARHHVSEQHKPDRRAARHTQHAADAVVEGAIHPAVREEGGGERDPEQNHGGIAQHAHEADHEGRVRVQLLFDHVRAARVFRNVP